MHSWQLKKLGSSHNCYLHQHCFYSKSNLRCFCQRFLQSNSFGKNHSNTTTKIICLLPSAFSIIWPIFMLQKRADMMVKKSLRLPQILGICFAFTLYTLLGFILFEFSIMILKIFGFFEKRRRNLIPRKCVLSIAFFSKLVPNGDHPLCVRLYPPVIIPVLQRLVNCEQPKLPRYSKRKIAPTFITLWLAVVLRPFITQPQSQHMRLAVH